MTDPRSTHTLPQTPPSSATPKIGVLIVAYNAESTIERVLERIPQPVWERISEVFVFDDSSRDETSQLAALQQEAYPKLRVFRNEVNLGYGGNQKRGYRYAMERGLDVVVLLHGDGQYAPEVMEQLLDPIVSGGADAVFGSRMMEQGRALEGGMPYYKYFGNKILTKTQNALVGEDLTEYHSGYRAYRVGALKKLPLFENSNDFHFDNEIIVQLLAGGYRIEEVPIPTYYGDEICHVNGMSYAWNVMKTAVRYRLHRSGLLYDRKYDVRSHDKYVLKPNRYSSHSRMIELLDGVAGGRALDVLDVGCGAGVLARQIHARGHRLVGVDLYDSAEAREFCDEFRVTDVEQGLGLEPERTFDVILLSDILEHTRAPEKLLVEARRHLRAGGRILASTGNVANLYIRASLLLGHFDYTERGILDRTHYHLFTTHTFEDLFRTCGFRVERSVATPIPFELVAPRLERLTKLACAANALAARARPNLFAYQTVLEVSANDEAAEVLRAQQIDASYAEFAPKASATTSAESR